MSPDTDPLLIISESSTPDGQLKKLGIIKSDRAVLKTLYSTIVSKARIFPLKTPVHNLPLIFSFHMAYLIYRLDIQRPSSNPHSYYTPYNPLIKQLSLSAPEIPARTAGTSNFQPERPRI